MKNYYFLTFVFSIFIFVFTGTANAGVPCDPLKDTDGDGINDCLDLDDDNDGVLDDVESCSTSFLLDGNSLGFSGDVNAFPAQFTNVNRIAGLDVYVEVFGAFADPQTTLPSPRLQNDGTFNNGRLYANTNRVRFTFNGTVKPTTITVLSVNNLFARREANNNRVNERVTVDVDPSVQSSSTTVRSNVCGVNFFSASDIAVTGTSISHVYTMAVPPNNGGVLVARNSCGFESEFANNDGLNYVDYTYESPVQVLPVSTPGAYQPFSVSIEVCNLDTDGDGIPNHLDLDSDNDGIADVIENGGDDPDNNGLIGTGILTGADVNANGIPVDANGGSGLVVINSDSDTYPDFLDIDADNDGIVDVIESQYTMLYVAPSGIDTDGDGIDDSYDVDQGGAFSSGNVDTDNDGTPDRIDLDSDGDGSSDETEAAQGVWTSADTDGDGLADVFDDYSSINPPLTPDGTNADNDGQIPNQDASPAPANQFPNDYYADGRLESNWRDNFVIWFDCSTGEWKDNTGTVITLNSTNYNDYALMPGCCVADLSLDAIVDNIQIPSCGSLNITGCLTVEDFVINEGAVRLVEVTESDYGQYLGPTLNNLEFNMIMNEEGWHNIAFPVQITAAELQSQNNTVADPKLISLTNDLATTNLLWWDPATSSGKEQGFLITRNATAYSTHAYGTWHPVTSAENLTGRGYNYYIDGNFSNTTNVLKAIGTSHTEEFTYATSDNFGGWNLIPNIYPVTVSIAEMFNDGFFTGFDNVVWIWDPGDPNPSQPSQGLFSSGAYIAYDAQTGTALNPALGTNNGTIAPFQSFYIRRTSASTARRVNSDGTDYSADAEAVNPGLTTDPTPLDKVDGLPIAGQNTATGNNVPVTMKPSYRTACLITKHYKTNYDLMLLRVSDVQSPEMADVTEIVFDHSFTDEFDSGFDIDKLGVREAYPMIFSTLNNRALVINKMPYPENTTKVPVGVYASEDDRQLQIDMMQMPEGWYVFLEDKLTGAWHNLSNDNYLFRNETDFKMERFVLHFSMKTVPVKPAGPEIIAWGTQEGIELHFDNMTSEKAEISVTNIIGQVLHLNKSVNTSENYSIPISDQDTQVYTVTIVSQDMVKTIKVVR